MTKEKEKFTVRITADTKIDGAIVQVSKDATSLRNKLHSLLVSTCKVFHDEGFAASKIKGDKGQEALETAVKKFTVRVNGLQSASPYHTKAISVWIGMMLPLKWAEDTNIWYADFKDEVILKGKAFTKLRENPFWEVSPPPKAQPFIMHDELAKLIKRAETRMDKPKEGDVIVKAAMKHLREALKATEETS